VISGFRRKVDENSAFLGYCAACSVHSLPAIRDRALKMGPIGCHETSVRNCHYTLRNSPEERSSLLQKGKVVPVHIIQVCRGRRDIAPLILSLCTQWRWMVKFMSRLLDSRGGEYQFNTRLDKLQTLSQRSGEGNLFPLPGFEIGFVQPVAKSLYQLRYHRTGNNYCVELISWTKLVS